MIDMFPFVCGFIIYLFFNIITFRAYAKKEEITKVYILFIIYVYYTILAGYLIQLVDYNIIDSNFMEVFMQILIFAFAGGLSMVFYYRNNIKVADQKRSSSYKNV